MERPYFELNKALGYMKVQNDPRAAKFNWPLENEADIESFQMELGVNNMIVEYAETYYKKKLNSLKSEKSRHHWSNEEMCQQMQQHFLPMSKNQESFWLTGTNSRATHYGEETAMDPQEPVAAGPTAAAGSVNSSNEESSDTATDEEEVSNAFWTQYWAQQEKRN